MVKNCDAKWDAHQCSAPIHLWLRNNIFYCRMELPRIAGKRRYKRISLHTNNYYEARTLMNEQQELLNNINELRRLYKQLSFTDSTGVDFPFFDDSPSHNLPIGNLGFGNSSFLRKISKYNSKNLLERIWGLFKKLEPQEKQLPGDVQKMVITIRASKDVLNQKINITIEPNSTQATVSKQPIQSLVQLPVTQPITQSTIANNPSYTIQEIFNAMLLKGNNKKASKDRKKNMIVKMLEEVGLSLKDDYAKFHDIKIIDRISQNVLNIQGLKNGGKKTRLAYIKELVSCACAMEPDIYSMKVIANLPNVKKDNPKSAKKHKKYSKEQLLNIFDPNHTFFQNNPDCFWICTVSLFTGSRANAAITLQYNDIINEDGIDCIHFQENNGAKQLKNQAAERKVPIHHQLLDLGFLDYVKRKKSKLKASGTDFIFEGAVHKKSQAYNNKYISRNLTPFLKEIGVKKEVHDGYDFHSFRHTASHMMQDNGLPESYINDIAGWGSKGTMEESYSEHTLDQIKQQVDRFEYDFLKPHFAKWKAIMAKKP